MYFFLFLQMIITSGIIYFRKWIAPMFNNEYYRNMLTGLIWSNIYYWIVFLLPIVSMNSYLLTHQIWDFQILNNISFWFMFNYVFTRVLPTGIIIFVIYFLGENFFIKYSCLSMSRLEQYKNKIYSKSCKRFNEINCLIIALIILLILISYIINQIWFSNVIFTLFFGSSFILSIYFSISSLKKLCKIIFEFNKTKHEDFSIFLENQQEMISNKKSEIAKWMPIVLLLSPMITLSSMTNSIGDTLRVLYLGNINVTVMFMEDKPVYIDGVLLLRTHEFYYIKANEKTYVLPSANTVLTYKIN